MAGVDDEYEERLTLLGAMRWFRDSFATWFVTFWMIAFFYALGIGLAIFFFQVDAEFSRPLAGGVVPPEVTQHLAWAIRAFSIVVGMAAMYCHVNEMPRFRNMLVSMGVFAALLLFVHALGISAKIMEGQYRNAVAIVDMESATTSTNADQIAVLQKQIDDITKDKDARVTRLQSAIDKITGDRLDNDKEADPYRADQDKAETDAAALITPLRNQIIELTASTGKTVVQATEDKAETNSFNELYTFLARIVSWTWNPAVKPSDTLQFVSGFVFLAAFFGFCENLMMACFTIGYAMQIVVSKKRQMPVEAKEGEVIIKMTEQEAAEMQEALQHYAKLREGHLKSGETNKRKSRQDTKRLEANQYMEKRAARVLRQRRTGASVSDISKSLGVTPAVLGLEMRQWLTDAEYRYVFDGGPDPQGDTGENVASGS